MDPTSAAYQPSWNIHEHSEDLCETMNGSMLMSPILSSDVVSGRHLQLGSLQRNAKNNWIQEGSSYQNDQHNHNNQSSWNSVNKPQAEQRVDTQNFRDVSQGSIWGNSHKSYSRSTNSDDHSKGTRSSTTEYELSNSLQHMRFMNDNKGEIDALESIHNSFSQNQPPKQSDHRESFKAIDFGISRESSDNSYNSSYPISGSIESKSSLQQAATAFYPASISGSTVPGLVGAGSSSTSSSVFTGQYWQQPSSLTAAAARGSSYSVAPPPGFLGDKSNQRGSRCTSTLTKNRILKGSNGNRDIHRGPSSPVTALMDYSNHSRSSMYTETKDDMTMYSTTSTTTNTTATSAYHPIAEATSSQAIQALMEPVVTRQDSIGGISSYSYSSSQPQSSILPQQPIDDFMVALERSLDVDTDTDGELSLQLEEMDLYPHQEDDSWSDSRSDSNGKSKKHEWLLRMNRKLEEIPVGELDPATVPISAIMNAWAKTKSAQGAAKVEIWLKRAQEEFDVGNRRVVPTTKMYTMAVDAWARSGEGGAAAQRAEALLQQMHELYQSGGHDSLRPSNAIFNAVINAWARSREKIAAVRSEQILNWMQNLRELDIQPDKYTFNTVIHAWAKTGGADSAAKAQELLARMHKMYQEGNLLAKPDTISYNVVINAWAKSGGKGSANEAEKLLARMHRLHEMGDPDVKPNVVTYGAVIDSFAKCGERGAAARADTLLANMIQLHQSDPVKHADLLPNTYVFNTVINCWAKSKEHDAASKAEEMLVAMSRLHSSGMPSLKPDNFTYTAVIDAWAKSNYRGAAARADQLLDKMEAKYLAGDVDLKPNSYTYNAVICALAKSGEAGAAARAERVLQNMVNRHRVGGDDDIKPTTINFNTVLDAWAKSRGGRAAAERAEEILEWMDRLHKSGNPDVKVDTISFNAVLDAWARSGDRVAPRRAEQILAHMDELCRAGNKGVKPDRYTYNTLINVWAKSGERGSAARAEQVLSVMEKRFREGDQDFKPNTRTYTSVIDAWAKSGEKGAARRAEQILNNMISRYEAAGDPDVKPNVHTANAVCNACAFSKNEEDRIEALEIAFRVFDWLANQTEMNPDSYTFTILLSVCANLLPREDLITRYNHASTFFEACRDAGYINEYVIRKLRQTVTEDEFLSLIEYRSDTSASSMPASWTRNAKPDQSHRAVGGGRGRGGFRGRSRR